MKFHLICILIIGALNIAFSQTVPPEEAKEFALKQAKTIGDKITAAIKITRDDREKEKLKSIMAQLSKWHNAIDKNPAAATKVAADLNGMLGRQDFQTFRVSEENKANNLNADVLLGVKTNWPWPLNIIIRREGNP